MTLPTDAIVVPWELDRRARQRLRRFFCVLCNHQLGGARAVASTIDPVALEGDPDIRPLWVTHHACYVDAFRAALRRVPLLATAPTEEAAHEAFRSVLDQRAGQLIT